MGRFDAMRHANDSHLAVHVIEAGTLLLYLTDYIRSSCSTSSIVTRTVVLGASSSSKAGQELERGLDIGIQKAR